MVMHILMVSDNNEGGRLVIMVNNGNDNRRDYFLNSQISSKWPLASQCAHENIVNISPNGRQLRKSI